MKTYKINNVEISEEQIKEVIKNNPELLNENKGGRYFFPKEGEDYWYVLQDGHVSFNYSYNSDFDRSVILQGVYRTEEEAKLASAKQRAIVACWKWAQENAPFEPEWGDEGQTKFSVKFDHDEKIFWVDYCCDYQDQFTLPYFKSEKDCEAFINANKEHLELLFTK